MEWDQFIFYKGHKLYKKIQKSLKPKDIFFHYEIQKEEVTILKYLILLNPEPVQLSLTRDSISLTKIQLNFPESISLLLDKESSKKFIRLILCFMSGSLYFANLEKNIQISKETTFLNLYKNIVSLFPGIRIEWRELMIQLKEIRKLNLNHFLNLKKIILAPSQKIKNESIHIQPGKDFSSKMKKKNLETKDSKQKLNLDESELLKVDEKKIDEYTLGHNFEKIETVEEFDGQWRDIDGEEDMEEEEALEELNLRHVIRTEDSVHTTRTTDSGSGTLIEMQNLNEEGITNLYPEWDYKKRIYKKDYCSVLEENFQETDASYVEKVLVQGRRNLISLNKKLEILINERNIKKRLSSGTDIDFDALITRFCDLTAKKTPSEFIYTNSNKNFSDITLYFLMDLSLSTDSWVHGKRILDVERETLIYFSEALHHLNIPFGIGGFYSRTRNHCKFLSIKKISENWEMTKNKMGSLTPIGYTRIGPALRHVASFFKKNKSKQKWIILLTDAKPNDYDKYEGKYGIEDVNQAVKECLIESIQIHTLAIGTEEKPTIPAMMRDASFKMLLHPENLLDSLQEFFKRALIR